MLRALLLGILWTTCVLYPDPRLLFASVSRAWRPVIEPAAVRDLAAGLPTDPRAIEAYVNTHLIPYAVPWTTYGVPWFYPTPSGALARGEGDCQARAVVLASILQAKGIPYQLVGSLDHMWVDYPGKRPTANENLQVALAVRSMDGTVRFRRPPGFDWRQSWEIERSYFWDAMPAHRRWLLVGGWAGLASWLRLRGQSCLGRPGLGTAGATG